MSIAKHGFIFNKGLWIGEGRVTFNVSSEKLRFYTKWSSEKEQDNAFYWNQQVEMEGGESLVYNHFTFTDFHKDTFLLELTCDSIGTVMGKGVIDPKTIAWEFRGNPEFEGFEVYEKEENGDYMFHAEYSSSELVRTIIDGRIWKKS